MVDTAEGNSVITSKDSRNPANVVSLKQVGIMRGKKVFSLIVCPYDYNSGAGKLTYYRTVNVSLTSDRSFPPDFDNLAKAQKTLTGSSEPVNLRKASAQQLPSGSYIRIVVNREGIYHITGYDLDTAGVNISGITSENMTLWNHGKQIPIYVYTTSGGQFTKDSYFEFYGTPNLINYSGGRPDMYLDPFTDNNVYFLTKDSTAPAQHLVTESGALNRVSNATDLSGYSFTQIAHLEKDGQFLRLDAVDPDQTYDKRDHWYWTEVSSNQMVTVPFYLSYPDTTSIQPLLITAAFHGVTHLDGQNGSPNVPNEHQAELFINQSHVLNTTWNGQTMQIAQVGADANIPQSVLHHGTNNFQVYDANPGTIAVTTFAFNWVELKYQRLYVADKDYIRFTIPDNALPGFYNFTIQNFHNSSVSVYRLNVSRITDVTIQSLSSQGSTRGYGALFQAYVQSTGDQFIAVSDDGKLKPVQIEQIPNVGLSSYDYSADYIMIVNRQLDDVVKNTDPNNPISRLASWYNSHGTKTIVVDADEIYDEFSYGIKSPYGIKSFISYAYHNWSNIPKYVLLVGIGTWNTKNGNDAQNLIPVMMMQTSTFGATAADNFYACVDGDDPLPDIAVGRIPAATIDQLNTVVDKILSYYSNKSFGWQNAALLIGGEENVFHTQTESIVNSMIPSNFFIKRLYTSIQDPQVDTKYYGTTQDLLGYFNQGLALVNFMGHGGGAIWADNGILTNDEISGMSNKDKYPFITSMTCFSGAFDGQEGLPLSSTLLFGENKGAIGVLASAGLGWRDNDFLMISKLLPLIFDSTTSGSSIGSDLMVAKSLYYASWVEPPVTPTTMVNQYNLIGDPALVIQLPQNNSTVQLNSYTVSSGQNVSGNVSNGPPGGSGIVQLTNNESDMLAEANVSLDNTGAGSFSVPFSGGFSGTGHVKVYTYNSSLQSSSSIDYSTGNSFVQIANFGITQSTGSFQVSVTAYATSSSNIATLRFVGKIYSSASSGANNPVASLSIPLALSQNKYFGAGYISSDTLKPGEIITGNLQATLSDGSVVGGQQASYPVPGAADLSAFSPQGFVNINSTIMVTADTVVKLEAQVYDLNRVPVENLRVDFYDGSRMSGNFLGSARVNMDTTSQKVVSIPATLSGGGHTIYIYIVFDSLTIGYDLHPGNNYAYNNILVNFFVANLSGMVALDSAAVLSGASPGEIFQAQRVFPPLYPQPSIFQAKSKSAGLQYFQFTPVKYSNGENYAVALKISDPDSATNANLSGLHLYIYNPRSQTLNLVGGNYANGAVTANVSSLGIFSAAFSTDHTSPQVTISVGDQFFSSGDYVPPNPRFSFLLHDEDGIDLNKNDIDVEVDGKKVDTASVILPDTVTNPTSVAATVQLPIKDGSHNLQVMAKDANGNVSNPASIDFVVRSDFSLKVYGAYPDPFVSQTLIAFEVTSANPIDAVEVKIYTVSGRLVRTIRYPSNNPEETVGLLQGGTGSPTAVGYHEAWWDCTDSYGNQVANGVYFYKVSVSSGGKTLEDIGKMARLR